MKKVLSLVLALVLAFGMATVAFAAEKVEVKSGGLSYGLGASGPFDVTDYDLDEIQPSDKKYEFYMDPADFLNTEVSPGKNELTTSKLSSANITVKTKKTKGSDLIKEVKFKNYTSGGIKTVYVQVEFYDTFVSTSSKDFDFTVYLAKKGSKIQDTELQITGTMKNEVIEVDEGEDEVNLSEGHVAEAIAYIKGIKVDTGNGLFINTKMFDGKKYYAKSTLDISAADDAVVTQYPEIDTIYTLQTIGMNSAGNTVEFDIDDTYYVYNADGAYIGMSSDKLPFSSKYYMATARIDMGGTVTEEPGSDEVPTDPANPPMGGDDVPANENDNPGTGANGFVNVAVAAGLVALAAAGAVSLKK